MAWVDKAPHVKIRRKYRCDVCDHVFEMRHESADEPMPDCPKCVEAGAAAMASGVSYIPPMPAINTSKAKAIDLAQKIAEEDFGLTDMNDNQRAGDVAFKGPEPMQTAERESAIREMLAWQAAQDAKVAMPLPSGPLLADGSRGVVSAENRHMLVDPNLQAQNYWQGNQGGAADNTIGQGAAAKAASQAAAADGVDPVGILQEGRRSGSMPMRLNVMGAVPSTDLPQELQAGQAKTAAGG